MFTIPIGELLISLLLANKYQWLISFAEFHPIVLQFENLINQINLLLNMKYNNLGCPQAKVQAQTMDMPGNDVVGELATLNHA